MKENWFNSMLMEGGKISHKRVISVACAAVLVWGITYAVVKALNDTGRYNIIVATMVFILVMAGVTTIPQIVGLIRGTPPPKDEPTEPKKD